MARRWGDTRLWVKGLLVLALPVLCLLAMGIANLIVGHKLDDLSRTTTATTTSVADVDRALQLVLDAETGVRGYAATGNPVFLQPYDRAVRELAYLDAPGHTIDGLDPAESDELRQLGTEDFVALGRIKAGIADGSLQGAALEAELLKGNAYSDRIRAVVGEAQTTQREELADQQQQVDAAQDAARIINVVGLVVGILAGLLAMLILLRGVLWRVARVGRNVDHFLAGTPMELGDGPTRDEIGHLEVVLLGAAELLAQRERDLQAARDEAVTATRAKDHFLGRMSHELRTPLTAILGFGQLLQMEDLGDEDADCVDHIVSAGQHLLALIQDLLDISRIETDHLSLSLEPILLDELVADSVALLGPQAAEHQVTVEHGGLGPGVVQADRQRLKQILLNLLSNAIKYNRPGGSVVVAWEPGPGTTVALTVRDTGMGILAENVSRLFQPFDRLGAESSEVEGTGVGLSLSRALAEAMGGTITAESEQGVGSAFTVTLPSAELDEGAAPASTRRPPLGQLPLGQPAAGRPMVLYAEDNLASLGVIDRLLRRRGVTLQVAMQGKLVLELARSQPPMLILLDLHL
ncbi:MAG TPA: ATP-binding protein, partial [Acidimicrobiales bacterium]|nr:ATP-binding protein [Acidimicrobiales bacterium]